MRDRVRSVQRDMVIKQNVLDAERRRHIASAHHGDDAAPACFTCERCKHLDARDAELNAGVDDADER